MKRRISVLLLAVGLGAGIAVAVQAPAQASYSSCASGTVCTWDNPDGSGSPRIAFWASPGTCFELTGAADNSADSFRNHITTHIQFYDNHGCTGTLLKDATGATIFDGITQQNFMQQDQVISHPGCQYPSTCFRNRASSVFFNTGFAGPLLLVQSYTQCTSGYVCGWTQYNGAGEYVLNPPIYRSPGTCYNLPSSDDNRINSIYNHLGNGHHVQGYVDRNCTGTHIFTDCCGSSPVPAGAQTNVQAGPVIDSRNKMSSIFFNTG